MKRLIFLLLAVCCSAVSPLRADSRSDELLKALRTEIRSYTSYRLHLTATVASEGSAHGTITVSGQRFAAKILGQELYYDGNTLWIYDPSEKEVVVERLDPSDPSVLSNPSKLLNVNPEDYNHRRLGATTIGKTTLQVLELTPKTKTPDYTAIRLYIPTDGILPQRISIDTPATDTPIELYLNRLEPNIAVQESTFRFDTQAHRNVEVIDFR